MKGIDRVSLQDHTVTFIKIDANFKPRYEFNMY
jgi:hypothetical protein